MLDILADGARRTSEGVTRIVPLDLSTELRWQGPATGPGLLASFVRIVSGEYVTLNPNATSQVFYAFDDSGTVQQGETVLPFTKGDFFALPGGTEVVLTAEATARLYNVNDEPCWAILEQLPQRRDSRRRYILPPGHRRNSRRSRTLSAPPGATASALPTSFGRRHVIPHLPAFLDQYPKIDVDAVVTDEVLNIIDSRKDVAVRIGVLPDSQLKARQLAVHRRIVCASPGYLAEHGTLASPADLAGHAVVRFALRPTTSGCS